MPLYVDPDLPTCMFCRDKGLTHDQHNGFRFCGCPAGVAARERDTEIAARANANAAARGAR